VNRSIVRWLFGFATFLCLSGFGMCAFASGTDCPAGGRHEFESRIIRMNTETQEGLVENKCVRCGYSYFETLPMTGHVYTDWEVLEEPSDGHAGIEIRHCLICGREFTREYLPAGAVGTAGDGAGGGGADGGLVSGVSGGADGGLVGSVTGGADGTAALYGDAVAASGLMMLGAGGSGGGSAGDGGPNMADAVLLGGIGCVWSLVCVALWYDGLVIRWDRRLRGRLRHNT
jgi:hypothetical protein